MSADPLLIVGDFNIHVNSKLDNDVQKVLDLLQSMGLHAAACRISYTRISGNTLDLVITWNVDSIVRSQPRPDRCLSDHIAVLFELVTSKPPPFKRSVRTGQ